MQCIGCWYRLFLHLSGNQLRLTKIVRLFEENRESPTSSSISLWTGLLAGIISGITYYAGYPAIAVAFYIIIYLIENLRKPIAISETANQLDTDILATVLSTASQFETLFAALLSAMLGVFADHFGLGIAIASVSVFVLITAPLFIVRHSAKNQSLSKF